MKILCGNVKRSTIDEPCCELPSLVRASLTLLVEKNQNKHGQMKLLPITKKIGHHKLKNNVFSPAAKPQAMTCNA